MNGILKNPNLFRRWSLSSLLVLILGVVIIEMCTGISLYPWDVIIIIFAGLIWGILFFLFWRCPHCEKSLPRSDGDLEFCPFCGEALRQKTE